MYLRCSTPCGSILVRYFDSDNETRPGAAGGSACLLVKRFEIRLWASTQVSLPGSGKEPIRG